MIEKTVRMSLLFDFYGQLLTQRQQEFFKLYYDDDLSLGEIAVPVRSQPAGCLRHPQAFVAGARGVESKLQLVERFQRRQSALAQAMAEIDAAMEALSPLEAMGDVVQRLACSGRARRG